MIMKMILTTLLFLVFSTVLSQEATLAFLIKEKDIIAEGITYDPNDQVFYLSSIHKKKVVSISKKGQVADFILPGQDSVQQVLGMTVRNGKLWLCNNTPKHDTVFRQANLHVYDLRSKKLINRFKLQDGTRHLFNDLYIMRNGEVYVTDSEAGTVYRIRTNSAILEELIPRGSLVYPNGITASEDESKILVSTGSARGIVTINVHTQQIQELPNNRFMTFGYDGLYRYKNTLIGVQNVLFPEAIHQMFVNDTWTQTEALRYLSGNDSRFDIPTTGVVVDDSFYFIANSQLMQLRGSNGKISNPGGLKETIILKLKLN
jgi:hypothetical protein